MELEKLVASVKELTEQVDKINQQLGENLVPHINTNFQNFAMNFVMIYKAFTHLGIDLGALCDCDECKKERGAIPRVKNLAHHH